jgi:putative inorganic carbon (HCO3(-)) transporter
MHLVIQLLAQAEIWFALVLVLLSMVWVYMLPWAVFGLGLLSIPRWLIQKRWSIRTPVNWLIAIIAILSLISLWVSPLPEVTAPQVYRLLTGLALFFAVVNWLNRSERTGWIAIGVASIPPALAVVAMFGVEWSSYKFSIIPASIYDTFSILMQDTIHPNVLAGNMAVVLPFSLALLFHPWGDNSIKPILRILLSIVLGALTIFSVVILVLTQSRGAWAAFGLACVLIVVLRFRWGWISVLLVGISSLVAGYTYLDVSWLKRWLYSSYMIGDLASRIELWTRGLFMIRDYFFTGIGMGTFAQTTNAIYPLAGDSPPHVHNLFLQVGVDLGMPGLVVWLAIFSLVTWSAWRVFCDQGKENSLRRSLALGFLGSQAALALHGMVDCVTWGMVRPAPLIWGLWGACIGIFLIKSRHPTTGAKNAATVV